MALSLKEKISYGFGDLGTGFMFDMGQLYLLKFFTDVAGIPAVIAGSVFLVTKLFDAVVDPIAGTIIEATRGKHPKVSYRHFMFFGCIILAIISVFVFLTPDLSLKGKVIYAYATYMIWGVFYSFTNIPYGTLAATMTREPQERTTLAAFRQLGSTMALLLSSLFVVPLVTKIGDQRLGYPIAIGVMALLGILAFFVTFRNCKEHLPCHNGSSEKLKFSEIAKTIGTNRPILVLILMTLFSISAFNLRSQILIYYCQYVLGNTILMPFVSFISIGCSLLGVVAMPILSRKFGKKNTVLIGFGISIVADLINFCLPQNLITFTIFQAIGYFGISIPNGMTWALVSDGIDYGEWKTGKNRGAITYSVFNFARKVAQAIAGFAGGFGLALVGYIPHAQQSADTQTGIKGLLLLYPAAALIVAGFIIVVLYNLSDKKYEEISAELRARNLAKGAEA